MYKYKLFSFLLLLSFIVSPLFGGAAQVMAQSASSTEKSASQPIQASIVNDEFGQSNTTGQMRTTTMAMRIAAALHGNQQGSASNVTYAGINPDTAKYSPLAKVGGQLTEMVNAVTDYFGVANWANSALPAVDKVSGNVTGGIHKFTSALPTFCPLTLGVGNNLGQCIPVASPDTTSFPGSDYYEIAVVEYREQMSLDLPAPGTKLRGYVQVVPSTWTGGTPVPLTTTNGLTMNIVDRQGNPVFGATKPHYLGPMILAQGCSEVANPNPANCTPRPVRVKFDNYLPTGPAGDLFLPTDTTYMGAGMGAGGSVLEVTMNPNGGGSGYTSPTTVTIAAPTCTPFPSPTCQQAAGTVDVINGQVTAVTVTNGGLGYTAAPAVSFGGTGTGASYTAVLAGLPGDMFSQNRATLHLHGGNSPWISDGTPHQWTTPNGESTFTSYLKGDSVAYVPDMWFDSFGNLNAACSGSMSCPGYSNDPGLGSLTFFWTNQQSGRLLFYHDHSYGITRINVYAGEAAGYLIVDPNEEAMLKLAGVPGTISNPANPLDPLNDLTHLIPLVIQDKTFVPDDGTAINSQLAATDPTWNTTAWGSTGDLWFPHVYMPNQNPADVTGANAYGRWDYGPWFWPPQDPSTFVPQGQPYACSSAFYSGTNQPAFPPLMCPGTPNPSGTPEGFMDTPVVNGTLYPTLTVDPTAYRFQMLMAGNDRTWNLQLYVAEPLSVAVTAGGSGYTAAPLVSFSGGAGGGTGVAATAVMSNGTITSILLTDVGKGYTSAPLVTIPPPGCTPFPSATCAQAVATASVDPITATIEGIHITNGGAGYTAVPLITIDPPAGCSTGCVTATATAFVTAPGVVLGITVTNPGSAPWTAAPTVSIAAPTCVPGPGCSPAGAIASVNSEVKMVPAEPHDATSTVPLCSQANPTSGAMLVPALTDASGNPINGTGLPLGCWPAQWPTDGRDGGVPDPLTAGPPMIQIGTESGLLPSPVVIPSTPVGYEYNRRSITVLNVFTHGLLLGPAERADVLVDFSQFAGKTLILYNDAPAPVPAFDSRTDYYTGDPDQTIAGGAPSTLPGYGPNTRTIMQITVNASPVAPMNMSSVNAGVTAQFVARQNQMIVPEPQFPAGNGGSATPTYSRISDTSFTGWFNGQVGSIALVAPNFGGSGYAFAPTVAIDPPLGAGTTATAAITFAGATVNTITLGLRGAGYTAPPLVSFVNGAGDLTGSGAKASATITNVVYTVAVTNGGTGYTSAPTVSFVGGGGSGATATATISAGRVTTVTVTNGGSGYASVPSVRFTGGGGSGARATATITGVVNGLLITNGGTGYIANPTVTIAAPTCTPGPNCIQATATATFLPGTVASLVLTYPGTGYTSAPLITFTPVGPAPTTAAMATAYPPLIKFGAKAIQELFTLDYGRMNATLGVELPFTNFFIQTTIPYGYIDPPTEMFQTGDTIFWKITHNGVDTHFIHFHLYDVQVINRVGWDGMIKPPDVNEVGWKDTVRMNPLEDIIVAMRPMKQTLPAGWSLPNSVRPLDVTESIGASNPANTTGFANIDPTNQPAAVTNDVTNFGWEYVVHCHILGHEENDMMRPQLLAIPPNPVNTVTATLQGSGATQSVLIQWIDGSGNETGFSVQRATNLNGPWLNIPASPPAPGTGTALKFTDTTIARRTSYYYRVVANNVVGYTQTYTLPAVGYPTLSADSVPVLASAPVTTLSIPSPIFADSFETGLNMWSGLIGDAINSSEAVISPNGGVYGMAATIGPQGQPAYVFDTSPTAEVMYDANFYFNPNGSVVNEPVDIFLGLDQSDQPIFGVQYQFIDTYDFQLRAWVLQAGVPDYTPWEVINITPSEYNTVGMTHKIDVAWTSAVLGGFSLYVDDELVYSLDGDSSAYQLEEITLGPSLGLSNGDTGTMYFDEFTSSRLDGSTHEVFVPVLTR